MTRFLTEASIELAWDGQSQRYSPTPRRPGDSFNHLDLPEVSTASRPGATPTPEVEDGRALDERIRQAVEHRRFLVLSVALKHLLRPEREPLKRYPLRRRSIEGLLMDQMAGQAGAWRTTCANGTAAVPEMADRLRIPRQEMPAVRGRPSKAWRQEVLIQAAAAWILGSAFVSRRW